MPQAPKPKIVRLCSRVYEDDLEYLTRMSQATDRAVSRDHIIRNIIRNYVTNLRAMERERIDQIPQRIDSQAEIQDA